MADENTEHLNPVPSIAPPLAYPFFRPSPSSHERVKTMTQVMLRDVMSSVCLGLSIAAEGLFDSLRCAEVRRVYRQSLLYWFVSCVVIYIVGLLCIVPIYVTLYFIDLILRRGMWEALPSVWLLLGEVVLAIPMLGALFVRYIYPQPFYAIFFASISSSTKEMLEKIPYPDLRFRAKAAFRKFRRTFVIGLALLLLSYLPRIGFLIVPLAQFYSTYQQLGPKLAILVAAPMLVPWFRGIWLVCVAFGWSARAICLELMDPYLGRLKCVEHRAFREFLSGNNQLVLVSFALPFTFLIAVPFVGPLGLPVFQSSAALFIEKVADKSTLKRLSEMSHTSVSLPVPAVLPAIDGCQNKLE